MGHPQDARRARFIRSQYPPSPRGRRRREIDRQPPRIFTESDKSARQARPRRSREKQEDHLSPGNERHPMWQLQLPCRHPLSKLLQNLHSLQAYFNENMARLHYLHKEFTNIGKITKT